MVTMQMELTFKCNAKNGRHGWLRLTPAYSFRLVQGILAGGNRPQYVLDPFSGTGTTGLVCAEQGIDSCLIEINPFLAWFAKVKTRNYSDDELNEATVLANTISRTALSKKEQRWVPPMNHIEKWWNSGNLASISCLLEAIDDECEGASEPVRNLLKVAFCRVIITHSNAAFNHQSVSLKKYTQTWFTDKSVIIKDFVNNVNQITVSARYRLTGKTNVICGDSRHLAELKKTGFDCVITSPPYSNRMSYIRELRPYMYWLGYLEEARQAGNMDWEAIGGTWGSATSRLSDWKPNGVPKNADFAELLNQISARSPILANYVHRYFEDMALHFSNIRKVLAPDAKLYYVIGNSKFYDTLVPVEEIFVSLLRSNGFKDVKSNILRKRSSKKALFEFVVSATN